MEAFFVYCSSVEFQVVDFSTSCLALFVFQVRICCYYCPEVDV